MYAISCDRCGEADLVPTTEASEIRFAGQTAHLCSRCHAELRAFLTGDDFPPVAHAGAVTTLETAAG